jgi:DNA polymerase II large subunit
MSENTALSRLRGIKMPEYYRNYYADLSTDTYTIFESAAEAKSSLVDSSGIIEPKIAFDLADRVAKMHEIDIADPQLRPNQA